MRNNRPNTFSKEKKKANVILNSTIILLNLTFSLINDKKGASTIVLYRKGFKKKTSNYY